MPTILMFPDQLRLINERSAAFGAAVAAAPTLDVRMPTHPTRTLFDHVQHVGMGRRKAAAVVAAGPADGPPEESAWGGDADAPREREALLAWWVESVEHLTSVLREAGPDRVCWTWWADSPSPQTSGAWARRQLHEGYSWRLRLSHDGAHVARLAPAAGEHPDMADAYARGTASDLVLFFYDRISLDSLMFEGDRRIFDQLAAWDPSV